MARISELHYSNAFAGSSGIPEFAEVALAIGEDPADFSLALYEANGSQGMVIALSDVPAGDVTFDADANENVFVLSGDASAFGFRLTDPDGNTTDSGFQNFEAVALVNTTTGDVINFYDIGGGTINITATDGLAVGETSENLTPENADPSLVTTSIQFLQPDPETAVFAEISRGDSGVICFGRDTMIATPSGQVPVQDLEVGDTVKTLDNGPQQIRWIGRRAVAAREKFAPVVIGDGVLGADGSFEVSQQHRILIRGMMAELMFGEWEVLVAAKNLTTFENIHLRTTGSVEYFHLLFDRHEIIRSNNVWTESLHPHMTALSTLQQAARDEIFSLFPELIEEHTNAFPAARTILRRYESTALLRSMKANA
ncbi:MAG: Hint domain-containing protein [Pseudomonadota bacterium]